MFERDTFLDLKDEKDSSFLFEDLKRMSNTRNEPRDLTVTKYHPSCLSVTLSRELARLSLQKQEKEYKNPDDEGATDLRAYFNQ